MNWIESNVKPFDSFDYDSGCLVRRANGTLERNFWFKNFNRERRRDGKGERKRERERERETYVKLTGML